MTMTWEERYRMLLAALKSNHEFWTPWLAERTTKRSIRDFFNFSDEEIKAAEDFLKAMETLAQDARNDPDYEPTEV